jgi:hypothetical protein
MTLNTMTNLTPTYLELGRSKEAETLEQKSLEAKKRILGDEHSYILESVMSLAAICSELGRFVEAIEMEKKNLETKKRVLGINDPDTLDSVRNLEVIYRKRSQSLNAIKIQEDDSLGSTLFIRTVDEVDGETSKTCR